jgi:hypothetical protein
MRTNRSLSAVIPQTGRVLDRQDMQPLHPPRGGRSGTGNDLFHAHLVVAQKTREPNLAGSIAAEGAHGNPTLPGLDKPTVQKGHPFCSRPSPKLPSPNSILCLRLANQRKQAKQRRSTFASPNGGKDV